jgi:Sodium/hydrogen exchanger family
MNIEPSVLFFLQLTIILAACRLVGWFARYLGQPAVVGEMVAGVLLGPSLFGQLVPGLHAFVFPSGSMPILFGLSQLGLTLYMFVVGLDFQVNHFWQHGKAAASVSVVGMIAPFVLGGIIAIWLHGSGGFFTEKPELSTKMRCLERRLERLLWQRVQSMMRPHGASSRCCCLARMATLLKRSLPSSAESLIQRPSCLC